MRVAAVIELGEVGGRADQASLDRFAGQEHGGGSAVVGSMGSILLEPSAELRKDQHDNPLVEPTRLEILKEPRHSPRDLSQQVLVREPL